jgi:RNA polymerase sigma-70 factor (ECF subfamily)
MQDSDLLSYIDGLFSYAMVLSRHRSEAEDLVQETYVRAIAAVNSVQQDNKVKSWLYTILRNIWLNQLRKRRTTPDMVDIDADETPADIPVDKAKDPHAAHVSCLEREQVQEAIRRLPVHFREVILLREYEELSYQDIAVMLNRPLGTVMSRLGRARSRLRSLLMNSAIFREPSPETEAGLEKEKVMEKRAS